MEFMEKLQKQKDEAKAAYIKARGEWWETRTAQNVNGDFEKWKIVCEKKARLYAVGRFYIGKCRRCSVPGFDSPACFYPDNRDILENGGKENGKSEC